MPPSGNIPAPLPPSVEHAYRQKCIDLKKRINEVEESNDALRLRRARTKRGILKLRLERAFLLEQLAKRTSVNVEDSDGSPSPPPPPQEKPLRTKRPHYRAPPSPARPPPSPPSAVTTPYDASQATFSILNPANEIPRSTNPAITTPNSKPGTAAVGNTPSGPPDAFALFCEEARPRLQAQHGHDLDFEIDKALMQAWRELDERGKQRCEENLEDIRRQTGAPGEAASSPPGVRSEDVEMEGTEENGEGAGGGFTAVNR
ncbi:hypothetical protein FGG08_001012 [Glutinoglossum americanum]|uniref:HMG box domain-containing protein n=1 Tax=Glutinoglossum americanum TaxID=1670608 RepID=A0A9P8L6J1_9PEZI|nr:hypothetical protein FGG08_001012 [Glutinoglossum americanum]